MNIFGKIKSWFSNKPMVMEEPVEKSVKMPLNSITPEEALKLTEKKPRKPRKTTVKKESA